MTWTPLANHLWQSTLFAGIAAILSLALRRNRAHLRHTIWLAASIKFLVPFSLLMTLGHSIEWRAPKPAPPFVSTAVAQISQPFAGNVFSTPAALPQKPALPAWPLLWLCGTAAVLISWGTRWRRLQAALRAGRPVDLAAPIPVISTPTALEPGVFGIFRPVLLLPRDITARLTPDQWTAILAHELCHIRRRDNLAAALHMLVEALFWFHPLVWWIGARLVDERERACDEEVLRQGNPAQTYAEGILQVCRLYLESPLACAAGVTGSDLKNRIEAIMTDRITKKLTATRKAMLAAAGIAAVAGPIFIGMLNAPQGRAQTKKESPAFEVASIKLGDPDARGVRLQFTPGGGLNASNVRVRQLIEFAYEVQPDQIIGGPSWFNAQGYDIIAKAPASDAPTPGPMMSAADRDQFRLRVQNLLADRFQLVIHRETKEMPVYALVVAKGGPKMKEGTGDQIGIRAGRGEMSGNRVEMPNLARLLSRRVGRPVIDKTGLTGAYEFKLEWTPDITEGTGKGPGGGPMMKSEGPAGADAPGPSIFTALQEQLGLKLESTKGPVERIVIDKLERPAEN